MLIRLKVGNGNAVFIYPRVETAKFPTFAFQRQEQSIQNPAGFTIFCLHILHILKETRIKRHLKGIKAP
jgi:hypothetical protein